MKEPLDWNPTLKFFGTMNGASESHTNAFFQPDAETMVFVDMSLLNAYRAERFIRSLSEKQQKHSQPGLKNFYLCVTHNHFDHASGIGLIAYAIKIHFPGSMLNVIADESIAEETMVRLNAEGCAKKNGDKAVYQMFCYHPERQDFFSLQGHRADMCGYDYRFSLNLQKPPEWLVRTIPTTHSERLDGASGFVFRINRKMIVYSGDTNQIEPYIKYIDEVKHSPADSETPIEFYLDTATRESKRHLRFTDVSEILHEFAYWYSDLKIVLMHYDDRAKMRQLVKSRLPDEAGQQVFLAEKANLRQYCW